MAKTEQGKVLIKKLSVDTPMSKITLSDAPMSEDVWHHVFACIVQNTTTPAMERESKDTSHDH